jgi:sulfate transport system ATP-binding protein
MEVADVLCVMDAGRIVQTGPPRDLYERPANDFVMGFMGPVAHVDGQAVRPHDLVLTTDRGADGTEAMVSRVLYLGFEVRVELVLKSGDEVHAQLTKAEADELELKEGDIVWVRRPRPVLTAVNG